MDKTGKIALTILGVAALGIGGYYLWNKYRKPSSTGGPDFPAPTTAGVLWWYWIIYTDGSAGWFSEAVFNDIMLYPEDHAYADHKGPYAPGATS